MNKQTSFYKSTRSLRCALGQFATGVAVVTARGLKGYRVGMTINSFCSISLEPALIGWYIDNKSASYEDFVGAEGFTITVLSRGQEEVAHRFARRGVDKFNGMRSVNAGKYGVEIPSGCAVFRCRTAMQLPIGDHRLLVGQVIEFRKESRPPLLFHSGAFHQLEKTVCQAA